MHTPLLIELKIVNQGVIEYGVPTAETPGSAGYDLRACIDTPRILSPGDTITIPTGIAIHIMDRNFAACVFPRSGLAASFQLTLQNAVGLIDSDYQGEIKVLLRNEGVDTYKVNPGDRIAQLVFVPVVHPMMSIVTAFSNETTRGASGFGSTGIAVDPITTGLEQTTEYIVENLDTTSILPSDIISVTPMYTPTGQELLEQEYGDD